jgi:hypothetical protein
VVIVNASLNPGPNLYGMVVYGTDMGGTAQGSTIERM